MDPSLSTSIICVYKGRTSPYNLVCNKCVEFMETCNPIISSDDGFSSVSECSRYLCEGCNNLECLYNPKY